MIVLNIQKSDAEHFKIKHPQAQQSIHPSPELSQITQSPFHLLIHYHPQVCGFGQVYAFSHNSVMMVNLNLCVQVMNTAKVLKWLLCGEDESEVNNGQLPDQTRSDMF